MTLHPDAASPTASDAARSLREAVRTARASSHTRRLDTAVQSALNGFAEVFAALTNDAGVRDVELADARTRIAALIGAGHDPHSRRPVTPFAARRRPAGARPPPKA